MNRMLGVLCVLGLAAAGLGTSTAATPKDGSLTAKHRSVSWSGGPLNGSAPARRNATCNPELVSANPACDSFNLSVNLPAKAFKGTPVMHFTLTPSGSNIMDILVCPPGACANPQNTTDYTKFSNAPDVNGADAPPTGGVVEGDVTGPAAGVWKIRTDCEVCVNASYTMKVSVHTLVPPRLDPVGTFGWATMMLPGPGEGEPNIATDKSGRIFVNAPGTASSGSGFVWRSTDGGKHWSVNNGVDSISPESHDSDLAIAPDDETVYFMNLSDAAFSNLVFTSTDHGETYSGPGWAGGNSDRQWFAAGKNGRVYVAYHDLSGPPENMWLLRSDDHGKTFTHITNLNLNGGGTSGVMNYPDASCGNHMAQRPQIDPHNPDIIYIQYSISAAAGCYPASPLAPDHFFQQIWVAKSTDGGMTFTHTKVYETTTTTDHNLIAMDMDSAGNLYIAITEAGPIDRAFAGERVSELRERLGVDNPVVEAAEERSRESGEQQYSTHVRLLIGRNGGTVWSKPILVDQIPGNHSNVFAAVAAGDPGRVDLAWYVSPAGNFDDGKVRWTVAFAQSTDALSAHPHFKQSRVSKGVVHEGAICQSGLNCTVTGANRDLLDFMGIDLLPNGQAVIIWTNTMTGGNKEEFARQTKGIAARAKH